jgi:hypothetical protein
LNPLTSFHFANVFLRNSLQNEATSIFAIEVSLLRDKRTMPHLYFHKRYFRISNDDLFIPLSFTIIGRIAWMIILCTYLGFQFPDLASCLAGTFILVYLLSSIFFLFLIIFMDFAIMGISLQGAIIEVEKRKNINACLYARLFITYMQVISGFFGIFALSYADAIPCNATDAGTRLSQLLFSVNIIFQYLDVGCLSCCCYFTSSSLRLEREEEEEEDRENDIEEGRTPRRRVHHKSWRQSTGKDVTARWTTRAQLWLERVELFTGNLLESGGRPGEEMNSLAEFLAKFFHHDGFLDVVASDIVAGLILVRKEQETNRREAFEDLIANEPSEEGKEELIEQEEEQVTDIEKLVETSGFSVSVNPLCRPIPRSELNSRSNSGSDLLSRSRSNSGVGSGSATRSRSASGTGIREFTVGESHPKKIATLPRGTIKTIPEPDTSPMYDVEFLTSLKRYVLFSTIIYNHLVIRENSWQSKIRDGFFNIASCMFPTYEGIRINNWYIYGTVLEHPKPQGIEGVNFYCRNVTTLNKSDYLEDAELIYVSHTADVLRKPYAMFLDHKEEKVIISIRGTMFLEDLFTDVDCEATEMTEMGEKWGFNGKGRWSHSGCLKCADAMREDLDEIGFLKAIVGEHAPPPVAKGLREPTDKVSWLRLFPFFFLLLFLTAFLLGQNTQLLQIRNSRNWSFTWCRNCYSFNLNVT